jgi:hypothetical protein
LQKQDLIAHALRQGLFEDGDTSPEVLAAAKGRGDRQLRWKNPQLPFVPDMHRGVKTLLIIDKPALTGQARNTISTMGDLASCLPVLHTHDIRRGGAKDLGRIDRKALNENHEGISMDLGHHNIKSSRYYNGQMDTL